MMVGTTLLVLGLVFPALSLVTTVSSALTFWLTNRHSSAGLIPFIGPVLLTCYVFVEDRSRWMIPAVWTLDIGTVAFISVLPRLISDWWNTCSYTLIKTFYGKDGIQDAVITLHTTGRYLMKKSWSRRDGEYGIVGLGEPGTFSKDGDAFELVSHHGLRRRLVPAEKQSFLVEEQQGVRPELKDYSLNQWSLKSY
jgi:hypothetical protein